MPHAGRMRFGAGCGVLIAAPRAHSEPAWQARALACPRRQAPPLANPAHALAVASFQGARLCFGIHRLVADALIAELSFDADSAVALTLLVPRRCGVGVASG
jgi:hypothetical protein